METCAITADELKRVKKWIVDSCTASNLIPYPSIGLVIHLGRQGKEGGEQLLKLIRQREEAIKLAKIDPLRHGYEPGMWADARKLLETHDELLVLGGNDATKSWFIVKYGVETLVNRPDIDWAFFHSSEESSINQQQELVYNFLPPEYRNLGKRSKTTDVRWTKKGGFSDGRFCLPNGSRGFFFNFQQDPRVLSGYKLTGASCDEDAITIAHLEEIRARKIGRGGKTLLGFTPTEGYTPTIADFLAGSTIKEWKPSHFLKDGINIDQPGAPRGQMPYILQCRHENSAVICFHSEMNDLRPIEELEKQFGDATRGKKKIRLYGWPEKMAGVAIPKFGEVNIVKRTGPKVPGPVPPNPWKTIYPQLTRTGTNYRVVDPGGSKNWFIKWYRVVPVDENRPHIYVYREWPDMQTHGEWALPGNKHDGVPGPAQRSEFGRGYVEYKRLILTLEGWVWNESLGQWDGSKAEKIEQSWMDSRFGGAIVPSEDEGTSLIALMEQEQTDKEGRITGPSMTFDPAPGGGRSIANQQSIQFLNEWFDYDLNEPVTVFNCPHWYVVEDCEQSIYCYREYTGMDGEKGALKDVIDPDWYFVKTEPQYIDENLMLATSGGSY